MDIIANDVIQTLFTTQLLVRHNQKEISIWATQIRFHVEMRSDRIHVHSVHLNLVSLEGIATSGPNC